MGDIGVNRLACALTAYNTTLVRLNVSECNFGPEGFSALACAVTIHPKLEDLSVSGNYFSSDLESGADCLANFIAAVKASPSLVYIALSNMTQRGDDYKGGEALQGGVRLGSLCAALVQNTCTLTTINLSGNFIGSRGAQDFFVALLQCGQCQLCTLLLRGCSVGGKGAGGKGLGALVRYLESPASASLRYLDLAQNDFFDEKLTMVRSLATAVARNQTLEDLDLRDDRNLADLSPHAPAGRLFFVGEVHNHNHTLRNLSLSRLTDALQDKVQQVTARNKRWYSRSQAAAHVNAIAEGSGCIDGFNIASVAVTWLLDSSFLDDHPSLAAEAMFGASDDPRVYRARYMAEEKAALAGESKEDEGMGTEKGNDEEETIALRVRGKKRGRGI